jgi:hypothetical protein
MRATWSLPERVVRSIAPRIFRSGPTPAFPRGSLEAARALALSWTSFSETRNRWTFARSKGVPAFTLGEMED